MSGHYDVVVVGGGAAGIGAARRLAGEPLSVLLVEAGDRLGGRAWTVAGEGMKLDLGCGWLHSADRNSWSAIAEADGFAIDRTPPAWREQFENLGFSPAEQAEAMRACEAFETRLRDDPPESDRAADALERGCRWNGYLDAMSGFLNGASLRCLSVADYLKYSEAAGDENWRVREGYGALVAAAAAVVETRLGVAVARIDRRGAPLRLETDAGTLTADAAIVTVSTAVLAGGGLRFDPPLTDKVEAAAALPLGLANKLFLALEKPQEFAVDAHLTGDPRSAETGSYYLRPMGMPVVEAFFGGGAAQELERLGLPASADFALEQLSALIGSGFRKRARHVAGSAWGANAAIGGSYSQALPGQAGARALLAAPVEGRIFFAGEACSAADFSTAHGAHDTGIAAAEALLAARV